MLFANNCNTTLNGSLTNVATTMSVTSATGFPSPTGSQYFYCTLADAATQTTIEIVKVTAVSGTTFTIVRGQDGTSGTAFASGDVVSLRLVRASLNDFPKLDENNTFSYAPTFNTALGVASGGTGVTSATGTGAGASVVLSQNPAINSPVITAYSTSTIPLKVCGLSGQFTELFDVYTYNGGTLAFQINSSGAIATGTWYGSVIGAAYGGTGEAGTLTGILYGNGTSAHTVATTAQLLSGIGTLPVANGGTGLASLTAGYIPYGNGTSAFNSSANLYFDGNNLGLGVTPSAWSSTYYKTLQLAGNGNYIAGTTPSYSGAPYFFIGNNGYDDTGSGFKYTISSAAAQYVQVGGAHRWNIASAGTAGNAISFTQAMTLDSSGNLLVGTTGTNGKVAAYATSSDANRAVFRGDNTNGSYGGTFTYLTCSTGLSTNYDFIGAYANGTTAFRVRGDGTIFAQNTTVQSASDTRFKENVVDATDGLDVISALRPVRFDFKEGFGNNKKNQIGFIAQEIKTVFPDAVDVWGNSNEENNPYLSVGTGALIPVLVKALQELNNKFDAYVASHP